MGEASIIAIYATQSIWFGIGWRRYNNFELGIYFLCFSINIEFKKKTKSNNWLDFFGKHYFY